MESKVVIVNSMDDRGDATWGLGGEVRKGFQNDVRPDQSRMAAEERLKQRQGGMREISKLHVRGQREPVRPREVRAKSQHKNCVVIFYMSPLPAFPR